MSNRSCLKVIPHGFSSGGPSRTSTGAVAVDRFRDLGVAGGPEDRTGFRVRIEEFDLLG